MRLTLALLTGVMLASAASAQSISPELQARGAVAAYAPMVAVAPEIATAAPTAAQEIDRTEVDAAVAAPVLPGPAQGSAGRGAAPRTGALPGDEKLQPVRKARVEAPRTDTRRSADRSDAGSAHRAPPVVSGSRNLGRFWPPVF